MRRISRAVAVVAATAALAALTGCAGQGETPDDPLLLPPEVVRLYGTDGNMFNSVGDLLVDHPNGIVGMKGTTPLSRLSQNFKDRLRSVDPQLTDDSYAGETYDAVVISALAAQIAQTTEPRAIADQINGVTTTGTPCDTPLACLNLVAAGTDIAYRGISLGLGGFTDAGEPSASTYGILRFADSNHLDALQTQYVPAGDPNRATTQAPPAPARTVGTGPLKIGALLPKTGDLASAGPPMFAGALLAIREINEAGGVLGRPVTWIDGDDDTDSELAKATAERPDQPGGPRDHRGRRLVDHPRPCCRRSSPPASSCSRRATRRPTLSTVDDEGLYFRTAPPDNLQAAALTDVIMRDGVRRIVIVARDDAYGRGLMEAVQENLRRAGLEDRRHPDDALQPRRARLQSARRGDQGSSPPTGC